MAPKTHGLVLTRSDQGDGGWSLHPAGTRDEQIAEGLVEPLLTGEAKLIDGRWDRPNQTDYDTAAAVQAARQEDVT